MSPNWAAGMVVLTWSLPTVATVAPVVRFTNRKPPSVQPFDDAACADPVVPTRADATRAAAISLALTMCALRDMSSSFRWRGSRADLTVGCAQSLAQLSFGRRTLGANGGWRAPFAHGPRQVHEDARCLHDREAVDARADHVLERGKWRMGPDLEVGAHALVLG